MDTSATKEEAMSELDETSNEEWMDSGSVEVKVELDIDDHDGLPTKSEKLYRTTYDRFVDWKQQNNMKFTTEPIIVMYFKELSEKYKPSTLWSLYSMLKKVIQMKEDIDIDKYHSFKAFLKKQSMGFKSTTSKVLSSRDVEKFLTEAPDDKYLATKVALIFGVSGGCRSSELTNIEVDDITKEGELLVVNLGRDATKRPRSFVIAKEMTEIVQKYSGLRPKRATTKRFFLNYQRGECTAQVIGIHKFSRMPKDIATYLGLDDPEKYTGHAFRRTSATLMGQGTMNFPTMKVGGSFKSSDVAPEDDMEKSIENELEISDIISASLGLAGSSRRDNDASPPNIVFKNCTFIINRHSQ